jgi:hypothetical protein
VNSTDFFAELAVGECLLRVRRARGGPGSRLVRELVRVERLEFTQLLLEATVMRLAALAEADGAQGVDRARERAGRAAAAFGFLARFVRRSATWHERARTSLWARLGAGADHDEFTFLARLLDTAVDGWPSASAIAEHARLVHEGPVAAAVHARALELEGESRAALAAHVAALDRAHTPRQRARAVEGLARVHLMAGRPRTALAPIVHHGGEWPFSRVALARAFASALALRDDAAAQRLGRLLREQRAPERTARAVEWAGCESAVETRTSEGLWR